MRAIFPRLISRGHIEAKRPRKAMWRRCKPFRGCLAAATLKRERAVGTVGC